MNVNKCVEALQAIGVTGRAGRTTGEACTALCLAAQRHVDYDPQVGITPTLVGKMFSTRWSDLTKAVEGGIAHFLSVDNGAYYAELWSQGENWYATTGAGEKSAKADKAQRGGIWQVPGVRKGMDARDAVPLFLRALDRGDFGGTRKGCGC